MKKSKLSLCLASGFVAALSLTACSSVSAKEGSVITVTDSNGTVHEILSNAIYNEYKETSDGVSKFYNAILEELIRYEYENPNAAIKAWTKSVKSKDEILKEAKNSVSNDKATATSRSKTNGTSYDKEWESILSSHNCLPRENESISGEEKLLQYYIYQLEKEDITDKFFLYQKGSSLTSEWIGIDKEGHQVSETVKGVFPYHIRHILSKISGGSTNFYDGTISQSEAARLGNIMADLLDENYTFALTAQELSEDDSGESSSARLGGDLGIMDTTTSFVNEFKLGIYAFDSIYTHDSQGDDATEVIRNGVGLDENYKFLLKDPSTGDLVQTSATNAFKNIINDGKLQEVPYDAFLKIKELSKQTKDNNGKQVNNGNEHYYPRNVIYNYYLNFHNPFVITKQLIDETSGLPKADDSGKYDNSNRFATISINGANKEVLVDEEGHVIIGVRSEHGIHFMIIEHSIYEYGAGDENVASMEEYYTTLTRSDSDYPKKADGSDKDTYVSFYTSSAQGSELDRAEKVKSAIKSFDSTYDYRLFDYILSVEGSKLKINDASLKDSINNYIAVTRSNNYRNAVKSLNEAWRSYTELVALQYDNRTEWEDVETTTDTFRTIHPRCAVGFKNHAGTAWNKGGVCYYED